MYLFSTPTDIAFSDQWKEDKLRKQELIQHLNVVVLHKPVVSEEPQLLS